MVGFCTNCGAPLKEGAGFCISCGTAAKGAAAPAPVPPQPPTAAVAAKSSPLLKIVIIGLAGIFVLGAMGIVGSIYVAHRIKRSVTEAARNRGVDLSAFSASSAYRGRLPDPCSLLTKEEASGILGVAIERTQAHGNTCDYFAQPMTPEQRQEQIKKALEAVQAHAKVQEAAGSRGETTNDANKLARESGIEDLAKGFVGGANPGSGPYFTVELSENGKAQIAAMKIAMGAVAPGMKASESLPGIGDEALMGPMDLLLVFTKNGLGVQIDLRQIPRGRDHAIAMAERILSRI
jgi:hypothetical protein